MLLKNPIFTFVSGLLLGTSFTLLATVYHAAVQIKERRYVNILFKLSRNYPA